MADIVNLLAAAAGAAPAEEADPDFANTVLLLHGDGTDGSQNNTFLDSSTNNFTITRNGNTTQGTFSPFSKPDGRWGNYFRNSGSDDYLSFGTNTAFAFGTGDFTLEAWIYLTQLPTAFPGQTAGIIIGTHSWAAGAGINWVFRVNASTGYLFFEAAGGANVTSTSAVPINQFNHVAAVRSGTTVTLYLNGVGVGSATISTNLTSTIPLTIGHASGGGAYGALTGYVSNARVVKGTAVYTGASFAPPTTPLTAISGTSLLTCQSNRFVDNSSNAFAITANGNVAVTPFSPFPITTAYDPSVNGGAGYFDGSGDYLTAPTDAGYDFTGDFTIELWVYTTRSTNQEFGTGTSAVFMGSGNSGWHIQIFNSSNALTFTNQVSNSFPINSTLESNAALIPLNAWNHIVVSRVGSTIRGFINGVQTSSTITSSSTISSNQYLSIGSGWGANYPFQGYIAGVKIVDGTGVTSVTVPTAPASTSGSPTIVCNFTNAGIYDNTCFNALETVGNAQIDTTTKKYGTGSIEFDGTGDYLKAAFGNNFDFGTGPFTVEFWLYLNSTSNQCFLDCRTGSPFLFDYSSNALRYYANSTVITGSALSTGQWYHIALTRDSSSDNRMFVDGSQVGSTVGNSTNLTGTTIAYIGANYVGGDALNGFIDDLRISRIARYSTTFTPPDKAFPDIGE